MPDILDDIINTLRSFPLGSPQRSLGEQAARVKAGRPLVATRTEEESIERRERESPEFAVSEEECPTWKDAMRWAGYTCKDEDENGGESED